MGTICCSLIEGVSYLLTYLLTNYHSSLETKKRAKEREKENKSFQFVHLDLFYFNRRNSTRIDEWLFSGKVLLMG